MTTGVRSGSSANSYLCGRGTCSAIPGKGVSRLVMAHLGPGHLH